MPWKLGDWIEQNGAVGESHRELGAIRGEGGGICAVGCWERGHGFVIGEGVEEDLAGSPAGEQPIVG